MRELLHQYFYIAFLMGKPQDLPVGRDQMKVGVLLALTTYILAASLIHGPLRGVLHAFVDLACVGVFLHFALSATGNINRFEQAFGGLCGASAFINLAAVPLYIVGVEGSEAAGHAMSTLHIFVLMVWGISLAGHIIRYSFDVSIMVSIFISFIYFIVMQLIFSIVLPAPALEPPASADMLSEGGFSMACYALDRVLG